jgi:hypothetical protein
MRIASGGRRWEACPGALPGRVAGPVTEQGDGRPDEGGKSAFY